MQIEKCSFSGIPECLKLTDGRIELVVTLSFGPRIIYCGLKGGNNFFRIWDNLIADPVPGKWNIFGGHRLWHAPEVSPRTYSPDNDPVQYREENGTIIIEGNEEKENHLRKTIEIRIADGKVKLRHTIHNTGLWDTELSVWTLSVMAPGTEIVVPQEEFMPHGHGPGASVLPVRPLVLWGYTDMADPRFTWGSRSIRMREFGGPDSKLKFGVLNNRNFTAALNFGQCFVKRFAAVPGAVYPDMGCNWEFYTAPGMLEMETLAPLGKIVPGGSASSEEEWELYDEVPEFVQDLL